MSNESSYRSLVSFFLCTLSSKHSKKIGKEAKNEKLCPVATNPFEDFMRILPSFSYRLECETSKRMPPRRSSWCLWAVVSVFVFSDNFVQRSHRLLCEEEDRIREISRVRRLKILLPCYHMKSVHTEQKFHYFWRALSWIWEPFHALRVWQTERKPQRQTPRTAATAAKFKETALFC